MKRRILLTLTLLVLCNSGVAAQNRSGSYLNAEGEVKIRGNNRSRPLNFSIAVRNRRGTCIGELEGNARWAAPNRAEYDDGEGCKLTFIFNGNRLRIQEPKYCGYHGVSCGFAGVYRRARRR